MLYGFILFDQNCAYVRVVAIVAFARHPRAALAAKLCIPRAIGVIFAHPPYAKTNGAGFIHAKGYLSSLGAYRLAPKVYTRGGQYLFRQALP